jgi:hypothetical protein
MICRYVRFGSEADIKVTSPSDLHLAVNLMSAIGQERMIRRSKGATQSEGGRRRAWTAAHHHRWPVSPISRMRRPFGRLRPNALCGMPVRVTLDGMDGFGLGNPDDSLPGCPPSDFEARLIAWGATSGIP